VPNTTHIPIYQSLPTTEHISIGKLTVLLLVNICCGMCMCYFEVRFWSRSQLWQFEVFQWLTTWRTWSKGLWRQRLDRSLLFLFLISVFMFVLRCTLMRILFLVG